MKCPPPKSKSSASQGKLFWLKVSKVTVLAAELPLPSVTKTVAVQSWLGWMPKYQIDRLVAGPAKDNCEVTATPFTTNCTFVDWKVLEADEATNFRPLFGSTKTVDA